MTQKIRNMLKYTDIRPVVMEGLPDAHHVFLVIDNQQFVVTPHGCDTKQNAEWVQLQLCKALATIAAGAADAGGA